MKLKPIGDKLVIEMVEVEEKTSSGIVLPTSAKEAPSVAKVLAIGDEILKDDDKKDLIKVGVRIIFSKYAGTEVKLDKKEYIVVKLADVLAVVEDEEVFKWLKKLNFMKMLEKVWKLVSINFQIL